jgi:hypothetical protein
MAFRYSLPTRLQAPDRRCLRLLRALPWSLHGAARTCVCNYRAAPVHDGARPMPAPAFRCRTNSLENLPDEAPARSAVPIAPCLTVRRRSAGQLQVARAKPDRFHPEIREMPRRGEEALPVHADYQMKTQSPKPGSDGERRCIQQFSLFPVFLEFPAYRRVIASWHAFYQFISPPCHRDKIVSVQE